MHKPKCTAQFFEDAGEMCWVCPNNMGSRRPRKYSVTQKCWKYNCPGINPPAISAVCAYELCSKPAVENSKYCSPRCRKAKHRRDYKIRKKNEKTL